MTQFDFAILCGKYLIPIGIALENPDLRAALADRNDAEVERILREEF